MITYNFCISSSLFYSSSDGLRCKKLPFLKLCKNTNHHLLEMNIPTTYLFKVHSNRCLSVAHRAEASDSEVDRSSMSSCGFNAYTWILNSHPRFKLLFVKNFPRSCLLAGEWSVLFWAGLNCNVYSRFALMCLFVLAALHSISFLVITVTLQSSLTLPHQRPLNHIVIFQFGLAVPVLLAILTHFVSQI